MSPKKSNIIADLHVHVVQYEDGGWEVFPPNIFQKAREGDVEGIGVIGQDTVRGLAKLIELAEADNQKHAEHQLTVLPCVQLSTLADIPHYDQRLIQILGIDTDIVNADGEVYSKYTFPRRHRNRAMADKFNQLQLGGQILFDTEVSDVMQEQDLAYVLLIQYAGEGLETNLGRILQQIRANIPQRNKEEPREYETQELVRGINKQFFSPDSPQETNCYVGYDSYASVDETIKLVLKYGGIPFLSNPFKTCNEDELMHLVPELQKQGLMGIEVFHPQHSSEQVAFLRNLAKQYTINIPKEHQEKYAKETQGRSLFLTGGSNFRSIVTSEHAIGEYGLNTKYFKQLLRAKK